ncbi:fibronectin type III domain-containing protein [Curtobacterium sp. MCBD17_040]|uniref:fibronectin type III domain-containing protein n=1 Tax=Curtobacterium sp. MCBD17_040 TaxID=2175674 RepID=UPI0015E8E41E|nr:fibronectin type III domain-containing protein [Curtobacterium sp. MCBD17_040]WIB65820.1 fibronectin type III domain-containing protein [Curtobacterium sp. MCBD17_040]
MNRDGTDSLGGGPQTLATPGGYTTSIVINHLIRGRTYTITVTGEGNYGPGLSSKVTIRVGPDLSTAPRNLVVTRDDENYFQGTVSAAWAPPLLTVGQKILGYQLTLQTMATQVPPTVVVLSPNTRSWTSDELGSTYTYLVSVSAITASGAGPAAQGSIQIGDVYRLYP